MIPRRLPIFFIVFNTILWNVLGHYYGYSISLYLFVLLLFVVFGFIRFKFIQYEDHLVYQILFFNISIVKKEIYPEEINQLKFIRVGWAEKAAIIKVNKGINIRLVVLSPEKGYEHLMKFAEKHAITVIKTKDYLILEKMK